MPSLNIDFLTKLYDDFRMFTCFIETGTNVGNTIFAMEPFFNQLYTIEFSEKYYNQTKNRYLGDKINFILGDSSIVFQKLLPEIKEKCIFFLDGHWSGEDTGKSDKDCPLYEEISAINELFKEEAIIIIDDFRLFGLDARSGKLGEDWSDINKDKLINLINTRISKVYHLDSELCKDDRLIIHINPK